ncbi:hypothetical protein [Aureimonas psammosilenae]|uniref:hypothetical protein n=1 Tax=Aureimonas psammosilenae TaxID=2495496 RepID=UPI001260747A|nr:hypothetical protein [Aureimonas psammosilenae]
MQKEGLMPDRVPTKFRTREERRRQAEYSARHRAAHADEPDMRIVDRALVEAIGLYIQALPPAEAKVLAPALAASAIAGLEYAGYSKKAARKAVGRRVLYFTSEACQGIVKAAKYRAEATSGDLRA